VTVIVLVVPLLLVTAIGMLVVGVISLLNPKTPGLINIVCGAAVVIISAITPDPGVGSVPSRRLASAVLLAVSV
jgi:hypothetical protein